MNDKTFRRLLGARILSEANDLKRTVEALASELGYQPEALKALLAGDGSVSELHDVISRMTEAYPIDGSDLRLEQDDCTAGLSIMRAEASEASSRVFDRVDRDGRLTPYYEYRDTACSRLSPFRPEWIRQLRVVHDLDPCNPDVAFNKGHLLHQYTLYVGAVNFYWEVAGRRQATATNTGDSSYGTPWWPHTFTRRPGDDPALILAVTFGGEVRRAQKELYVLSERTRDFVVDPRSPDRTLGQLVAHLMACDALGEDALERRLRDRGSELTLETIAARGTEVSLGDLRVLAECLGVEVAELLVPAYHPENEVVVERASARAEPYPDRAAPDYLVSPMARVSRLPLMRGMSVVPTRDRIDSVRPMRHGLHTWAYNYGSGPVALRWSDGVDTHETRIAPGDSFYAQPFVSYAYAATEGGEPRLCEVRVPGAMTLGAQRELSWFSEVDRVFLERSRWF